MHQREKMFGRIERATGKLPAALTNDNAPIDRRSGIEARRQTGQMMEFNRALIIGARMRGGRGLGRNRRLAKDFEATIGSAEAWLYMTSVQHLARRLARTGYH